jgi:hypothetical protein
VHGADETKGSRDSFKNGGVLKQPAKLWVYFVVRNVDTAEQIVGHGVGSQPCRLHFSLQSAPVAAEGQLQNSRTTCLRADEAGSRMCDMVQTNCAKEEIVTTAELNCRSTAVTDFP